MFIFFKNIAIGNFFEKNENFWQFLLKKCQVLGKFFDSQMTIFRRVRYQFHHIYQKRNNIFTLYISVLTVQRWSLSRGTQNPRYIPTVHQLAVLGGCQLHSDWLMLLGQLITRQSPVFLYGIAGEATLAQL